jgi:hypothetical protein
MRGPVLLVVRRLHLYLSVFFAPLLLLFIVSGLAQTMDFDHSTPLLRDLSQVHTKQFFPTAADAGKIGEKIDRARFTELTKPMRWLVAAMCGALLVFSASPRRCFYWPWPIFGDERGARR